MRIEAEKKLFTTDDFSKMYEAGILNNDERVELVDGEIIKLNPAIVMWRVAFARI